jgi:DNA-binding MarR family transcriptional regulator
MKNRLVLLLASTTLVTSTQNISARSFFPQIDQLRSKIDSVSKNTPQTNIKELLESARIEYDKNGVMHKIISLDQNQNPDVQSLEQESKQLYWSNRPDLVDLINAKQSAPKEERVALLQKELDLKYPKNPHAFITFAGDLVSEDTKLQDLSNRIFKKLSSEKDSQTAQKLNALLNKTTKLKNNLQTLTNTVNKIIMG